MGQPRRRRPFWVVPAVVLIGGLVIVGAAAFVLATSQGSLTTDPVALAKLDVPLGGAKVQSVVAVTGRHARRVPVALRNGAIWPLGSVPADERISIDVVVKRPGWISWLSGATERLHLTLVTPVASLRQHFITLKSGAPLVLHFVNPISAISYGPSPGALSRHVLSSPTSDVTLARTAEAGSIWVAAAPRTWEHSGASVVSWFPGGAVTAAVANPAPGSTIGPNTPLVLTFSKPVSQALGTSRPPVSPVTPGTWHQTGSHSIVFHPTGYGYGLGATVTVGLPAGVKLVGGRQGGSADVGTWRVPSGTTTRLQQLLATLGYLPLSFNAATSVAQTPQAQQSAAIHPPKGTFNWTYGNVPGLLRSMWAPGVSGEMTKGAVMAFENNEGMTTDGIAGAAVWKALIGAAISGRRSTFGYTFVQVSEGSPESESTWHNGKTVVSGPVNTGIPEAPTAQGTFAVFEHALSVTMSGTNPDGSHYSDPGIPFVSYFNGGDALHYFPRGGYGYPQSLGCVEMPYGEAEAVYPYTPIGTLVNVS